MGKWFLDFSFWTGGYRTAQTAHCAMEVVLVLPAVHDESSIAIDIDPVAVVGQDVPPRGEAHGAAHGSPSFQWPVVRHWRGGCR